MRILFITQYFPPETGAPQNRLFGLAQQLQKKGVEVVVLTAMPNYPLMKIHEAYKGKFFVKEEMDGIEIYRSWIYASKDRSVLKRLLNYFSFVKTSFLVSFRIKGKFDFVLCESPPLFLGISGYLISKFKRAKFIFNVSDLWPESAEKLGIIKNRLILKTATLLEEFLYRKSHLVTGQTQGIVQNISQRFPEKKVHWLPNGIDPEQFLSAELKSVRGELGLKPDDFVLIYAGIIGHAQGLEVILKAAVQLKTNPEIKFMLVGDGPEKEKLLAEKKRMNIENVFFHPSVSKELIKNYVFSSDASVIPLRNIELFKGAIPSKIFESLILEKPLLLGVEGEAKELFITSNKCGLYFSPENDAELASAILQLYNSKELQRQLGENGKRTVLEKFSRRAITEKFSSQMELQMRN